MHSQTHTHLHHSLAPSVSPLSLTPPDRHIFFNFKMALLSSCHEAIPPWLRHKGRNRGGDKESKSERVIERVGDNQRETERETERYRERIGYTKSDTGNEQEQKSVTDSSPTRSPALCSSAASLPRRLTDTATTTLQRNI